MFKILLPLLTMCQLIEKLVIHVLVYIFSKFLGPKKHVGNLYIYDDQYFFLWHPYWIFTFKEWINIFASNPELSWFKFILKIRILNICTLENIFTTSMAPQLVLFGMSSGKIFRSAKNKNQIVMITANICNRQCIRRKTNSYLWMSRKTIFFSIIRKT